MQPGCKVILDDDPLAGDLPKTELVATWVDRMVHRGAFIEDCVINSTRVQEAWDIKQRNVPTLLGSIRVVPSSATRRAWLGPQL